MSDSGTDLTYTYDDASWHYGGDYPEDLPESQALVHTGLFLGWLIDAGLVSEFFVRESDKEVMRFRARELSGPRVLEAWDGKLVAEMLNEQGNAFAREYFDFDTGRYLLDYEETLGAELPSLYHVEDSWENYEKLKPLLNQRFGEWLRSNQ